MVKLETILEVADKCLKKSNVLHKHGCVIVHNNKIISVGYNYHVNFSNGYTVHAEVDAINNISKKHRNILKNSTLYVIRKTNYDIYKSSKPCDNCAKYIKKYGISKIYYSVEDFDIILPP